jgi:hypothetical protein
MAKQASLAAQSGALTAPLETQMPAIFGSPGEDIKGREWGAKVVFAHSGKPDEYKRLVQALGGRAPDDMDMFLIESDTVTHLPTMKCGWLIGQQRWVTEVKKDGRWVIDKVKEEEDKTKGWKEIVDAALLVYLADRIVPAQCRFKTTKCPGAITLSKAAKEAATPEWAEKSDHHRATLAIQQSFWRFHGIVIVLPKRNPQGGGEPYRPTSCDIFPTGPNEVKLIEKFNRDPESKKLLDKCAEGYAARIASLKALQLKA